MTGSAVGTGCRLGVIPFENEKELIQIIKETWKLWDEWSADFAESELAALIGEMFKISRRLRGTGRGSVWSVQWWRAAGPFGPSAAQ